MHTLGAREKLQARGQKFLILNFKQPIINPTALLSAKTQAGYSGFPTG